MSDPLSVTASVAGIVGALLYRSKRLCEFIHNLQPKDIAALWTDLRAFYDILAYIAKVQDRLSSPLDLCFCYRVLLSLQDMRLFKFDAESKWPGLSKTRKSSFGIRS